MRRREFLGAVAASLGLPTAAEAAAPAALLDLRVDSDRAFAGDKRLFATVPPGGRARVSFRLTRRARIRMEALRTDTIRIGRPLGRVVWATERVLRAGRHELAWAPGPEIEPRTYILRLVVDSRRVYGGHRPRGRVDAPVVRVQGVEVATTRTSFRPGEPADLLIACDAPSLRVQVFHYGGGERPAERDLRTNGIAVTPAVTVDWRSHRRGQARLRLLRAGEWRSGLYFVRATTADGRVGYAPFILRPRRLGTERVAVVLSTNTWQAYNFTDADGDGWGDSWYVSDVIPSVEAARPYLDFGVPFRFRDWDLEFVAWLNRTGRGADFLADEDLETSGEALRRAYDLIVFPGHAEYMTTRAYDAVVRFRDLGGNLLFLAANNFFRRVRRDGRRIVREQLWRNLGRPESGLVGVQYVGSDQGQRQAPYVVVAAGEAPWLFEGTGLRDGEAFGRYGIEIDARTAASPPETRVLARAADVMGPGRSAELTYYETAAGARVLAAGAINFVASMTDPRVERLVANAWAHLSG